MSQSISNLSAPQQFAATQQEVPTDLIPIPSNGLVYPVGSPVANAETIAIRSMTAKDEDILTSRALLKNGKALTTLVSSCIVNKEINAGALLAGDRNAVLIGLRITGYGAGYEISLACPECMEKSKMTVDLSTLPVKRIPEGVAPIAPNTNEFEFTLPSNGKRVTFKLMTGDDEQEMLTGIERSRKAGIAEELVTTRLKHQIISLGGETDKTKLSQLIRNLPARDSRALRQYIDKVSPGVEMTTTFVCPACDFMDKEVEVPLGTDFFWPKT